MDEVWTCKKCDPIYCEVLYEWIDKVMISWRYLSSKGKYIIKIEIEEREMKVNLNVTWLHTIMVDIEYYTHTFVTNKKLTTHEFYYLLILAT